ncbi:MAG: hypothetical protein LBH06_06330 [Rikenellaceae bacterium]|nr:hypothetical protein [Rikenellaceae bacterium]
MKRSIYFAAVALFCCVTGLRAQKTIEVGAGADVVSSYVWRGVYQAGVSVQPSVSASYRGFTLGAWGSSDVGFAGMGHKEFDYSLFYSICGLSVGVTDYWWNGVGAPYFAAPYKDSHYFEGTVSYCFGEKFPLTLAWSTMFAGADTELDAQGKVRQMYSSWFEAAYDFRVKEVACTASLGVSPWKASWLGATRGATKEFTVAALGFKAAKEIAFTDKFSLPVFAQAILSPAADEAHLVFGISF